MLQSHDTGTVTERITQLSIPRVERMLQSHDTGTVTERITQLSIPRVERMLQSHDTGTVTERITWLSMPRGRTYVTVTWPKQWNRIQGFLSHFEMVKLDPAHRGLEKLKGWTVPPSKAAHWLSTCVLVNLLKALSLPECYVRPPLHISLSCLLGRCFM